MREGEAQTLGGIDDEVHAQARHRTWVLHEYCITQGTLFRLEASVITGRRTFQIMQFVHPGALLDAPSAFGPCRTTSQQPANDNRRRSAPGAPARRLLCMLPSWPQVAGAPEQSCRATSAAVPLRKAGSDNDAEKFRHNPGDKLNKICQCERFGWVIDKCGYTVQSKTAGFRRPVVCLQKLAWLACHHMRGHGICQSSEWNAPGRRWKSSGVISSANSLPCLIHAPLCGRGAQQPKAQLTTRAPLSPQHGVKRRKFAPRERSAPPLARLATRE